MINKRSNKKFSLGIAVAFFLPLSFYLVTVFMSRGKVHLPHYYVIDRVDSGVVQGKMQYDTVYHRVGELQLTNQLGKTVTLNKGLEDKIIVVNFFFTHCPVVCPRLSKNMALLQKAFRKTSMKQNDTLVQFVSITVNPERDTVGALRAYADRYGANHDHWWFLTGDKHTIYNYARNELGLSVVPGDGGADDFIHPDKFVLLDKDRNIRGYYNGLDSSSIHQCAEDVSMLSMEVKRNKKH